MNDDDVIKRGVAAEEEGIRFIKMAIGTVVITPVILYGSYLLYKKHQFPSFITPKTDEYWSALRQLHENFETCLKKNDPKKCKFEELLFNEKKQDAATYAHQVLATDQKFNEEKKHEFEKYVKATGNTLIDGNGNTTHLTVITKQVLDNAAPGWIQHGQGCDENFVRQLLKIAPTDLREDVHARKMLNDRASEPCAQILQTVFDQNIQKSITSL